MTLRIVLLEDVPADAALVERHLTKSGLEFLSQRVDTRARFEEALQKFVPDIVLSDHGLPGFDGSAALELVKQRSPTLPVILVTGSLNEEKAVEFMKAGAADYILKDHLTRLPEAIRRALRERVLREEREQAVAALRESEAQYRSLFESTPYPMWVFDLETHRVLAVNGAAIRHYGYSREEFLALRIEELRPPEDIPALHRHLATMPSDYHAAGTWRHRKKDGTLIEVETGGQGITFAGRQAEQVVINDVTERKRLEEQFRQAQKMEAVGRLAAGVAHDFNNLLTAILGTTDLMLEDLPPDDPDREGLLDIRSASERAAVLTRQLLTFSRQQVVSPQVLRLNDLVLELEKLLRRLLGEDVAIRVAVAPDCGAVKQSGGYIWLYSEVGQGTSFKIYLPRIDAAEPQPAAAEAAVPLDGSETVLVAEDEDAVRQIIEKALQARGYTVMVARDGNEALAIAGRHAGQIDLLVTDVVMPDMNGRALSERLTHVRPTIKTLYLSGYTDDAILHHGVLEEGVAFLQKPLSLGALARKVREVIEARP